MSQPLKTTRLAVEFIKYRPALFFYSFGMWAVVHGSPIAIGILIGQVFDRLTDSASAASSAWTPALIFTALVLGRNGIVWLGDVAWIGYWNEQASELRRNILRWILEAPGSRILPVSPSEAVSTFRDDVDELLEYVENFVDMGGLVVFGVGSVYIMSTIDAGLTVLILIPLILTILVTQALSPQIRARRRAMREATEAVTGFIGESFGAAQAVKLARAEGAVLAQFKRLNETRRVAALRDTFLTELLRSISVNMAGVGDRAAGGGRGHSRWLVLGG